VLAVKIWMDLLKCYGVIRVLRLGMGFREFLVRNSGKTMCARMCSRLSNVEFFVCLCVRHASE